MSIRKTSNFKEKHIIIKNSINNQLYNQVIYFLNDMLKEDRNVW